MRKSGTVHIVNKLSDIPFDVKPYRAIEYSTDISTLPDSIDSIATAIWRRLEQRDRSDNPVHDAIPGLPSDFRAASDPALREQINRLELALAHATADRERVERRLNDLDPSGSAAQDSDVVDIDAILDQADQRMEAAGPHALLRLQASIQRGGSVEFVKELREVLRSPYLSDNDFIEISLMCRRLGLLDHRIAALEVARRRFPDHEPFVFALADAYDDSPNRTLHERARLMLEEYLGVIHSADGVALESSPKGDWRGPFSLLCDLYSQAGKPELAVALCSAQEAVGGGTL